MHCSVWRGGGYRWNKFSKWGTKEEQGYTFLLLPVGITHVCTDVQSCWDPARAWIQFCFTNPTRKLLCVTWLNQGKWTYLGEVLKSYTKHYSSLKYYNIITKAFFSFLILLLHFSLPSCILVHSTLFYMWFKEVFCSILPWSIPPILPLYLIKE